MAVQNKILHPTSTSYCCRCSLQRCCLEFLINKLSSSSCHFNRTSVPHEAKTFASTVAQLQLNISVKYCDTEKDLKKSDLHRENEILYQADLWVRGWEGWGWPWPGKPTYRRSIRGPTLSQLKSIFRYIT